MNVELVTREELDLIADRISASFEAVVSRMTGASPQTTRDYFTREEAAEYLRMSTRTLDTLASQGDIRRAKIGNGAKCGVLYRRVDLDAFVEQRLGIDKRTAKANRA